MVNGKLEKWHHKTQYEVVLKIILFWKNLKSVSSFSLENIIPNSISSYAKSVLEAIS